MATTRFELHSLTARASFKPTTVVMERCPLHGTSAPGVGRALVRAVKDGWSATRPTERRRCAALRSIDGDVCGVLSLARLEHAHGLRALDDDGRAPAGLLLDADLRSAVGRDDDQVAGVEVEVEPHRFQSANAPGSVRSSSSAACSVWPAKNASMSIIESEPASCSAVVFAPFGAAAGARPIAGGTVERSGAWFGFCAGGVGVGARSEEHRSE